MSLHPEAEQNQELNPGATETPDYAKMITEAHESNQTKVMAEATKDSPESSAGPVETANFQGNWFNLQKDRMQSADFREKWARFRIQGLDSLPEGNPGQFDKAENFRISHPDTIPYDETLNSVTAVVGYVKSTEAGLSANNLGVGKFGESGTVFTDGASENDRISGRQKDIIAAHEAYHGMVDALGTGKDQVKAGFDWEVYSTASSRIADESKAAGASRQSTEYLRDPNEITARMAQLKNYYGMAAEEQFTPDHLDYAKAHYVEDTGLDNSMTLMLESITPKTQQEFVRLMNELPV